MKYHAVVVFKDGDVDILGIYFHESDAHRKVKIFKKDNPDYSIKIIEKKITHYREYNPLSIECLQEISDKFQQALDSSEGFLAIQLKLEEIIKNLRSNDE